MKAKSNLGIWMDHSIANLIDIDARKECGSIASNFTSDTKEDALNKSENRMHNKRQQMNEKFYDTIGAQILKYNHVLLFGPTNAKVELHNYLNKDSHFKNIKIDVASSDNITDNEQVAFVKNHFAKV